MSIQSLSQATTAAQCVCIIMTNGNNERKLLLFTFHNFSCFSGRGRPGRGKGKLYGKFNIFSENMSRMFWIQ